MDKSQQARAVGRNPAGSSILATRLQTDRPNQNRKAGRPKTQARHGDTAPIQLNKLVEGTPRTRYKTVSWRSGSRARMSSKFLTDRVRPAEKHTKGRPPPPEITFEPTR